MAVEKSIILRDIHNNPQIQERAEAIVRNHLWCTEGANVNSHIDLDQIMWAVAADQEIQNFVVDAMANAEEGRQFMTMPAIVQIDDTMLSRAVLDVAWPRLNPNA